MRIGILGGARIADAFCQGVAGSERISVLAVASRTPERGRAFADRHGIDHAGDYPALLARSDIDAVYVPLPNALHAEWSIAAARAGKHVLCEKPLGVSAHEVTLMQAAARESGVTLLEAFPYAAQPLFAELRRMLAVSTIGEIRQIDARFGFRLSDSPNIRRDAAMGGGALLDVGCYPVSLCVLLCGPPARVTAVAREFSPGVDRSTSAILEYADGMIARVGCWFDAAPMRRASLAGEDGVIETDFPNHTSADNPGLLAIRRGDRDGPLGPVTTATVNGFRAEAEAFAASVAGDADVWTGPSPAQSLAIAATLDAIRESTARRTPVSLG